MRGIHFYSTLLCASGAVIGNEPVDLMCLSCGRIKPTRYTYSCPFHLLLGKVIKMDAGPPENLIQIELITQEIVEGKHYLIELDRRQNQYREARRRLLKNPMDDDLYILCNGSVFVRSDCGTEKTIAYFDGKLEQGKAEIEAARNDLKLKVARLAQLEGPASALAELYKGFDLSGSQVTDIVSSVPNA